VPTQRQGEVLSLLALGLMSKQISVRLGIAENTVRNHVHGLLQMFEVSTRTACVARARAFGLVD
jgi:DNA-binding NarL/FixJ family response regulator